MSFLEVTFFNGFQIKAENRPITRFYSQKTKGLLVYLALEAADRPQTRSHLAGMLWPDFPDSRARRNLSQTLTALRKDLADQARPISLFYTTTQSVGFNADSDLSIDVLLFEDHLSAVQAHRHTSLFLCPDCTHRLEQAAGLYTGPLLDQFDLSDSDLFASWFVAKRERLLQQAIEAFTQLGHSYQAQGRRDEELQTIDRLLTLAPWYESGHRQRMLLLAQQGQRIQALNQYEILSDVLMSELGVSPAPETDELYDQILAGEIEPAVQTEATVPQTGSLANQAPVLPPPFQAPSISPHFVGREPEIEQMQQLIESNKLELNGSPIALVGMGGIGKTALVTFKAHQLKDRFADGVLWGNPMTSDPLNILDMWARAYGNDFSSLTDLESKATAVRGLLAHKETLIVLDNVEDAAAARHLLPNGGKCQVLMTTRNLDIAGSLNAQQVQMRELTTQNSQTLMIRILGEERVLGRPEEAAAAQRIGEQLHHLPLAIEIAAQRLRSRPSMSLVALAMRLEDTQQRMGLKISDQAVRSSFEVSWDGLTPLAQRVFMGMGIFGGRSFAAEALAAVTGLGLYDLEDELYSLITLSLVNEAGDGRYQQHPLLADFAAEKEQDLVGGRDNFIRYYLAFSQEHREKFEVLDPEWSNIMSAIEKAGEAGAWELVLGFADALGSSWLRYGRYADADRAYVLAQESALKISSDSYLATTLLHWAEIDIEKSAYIAASRKLNEAEKLFDEQCDKNGIALVNYNRGFILHNQNKYVDAKIFLEKSRSIQAEIGNRIEEAKTISLLAFHYFETDETVNRARELAHKALDLLGRNNQNEIAIAILKILVFSSIKNEDFDDAEQVANEALTLSKQLNQTAEIGDILRLMATINQKRGKYDVAEQLAEESLSYFQRLGNKLYEVAILYRLAQIYFFTDRLEESLQTIKTCLTACIQVEDRLSYGFSISFLGEIHLKMGATSEAIKNWNEADQIANKINHPTLKKHVQGLLRHVLN